MREIATPDYEQLAAPDYERLGLTPDRFNPAEAPAPPRPAPRRGFFRRQFEAQALAATRRLKVFGWIAPVEFDSLAWAYEREPDVAKRSRLARAYRELTGSDVENRLRVLND